MENGPSRSMKSKEKSIPQTDRQGLNTLTDSLPSESDVLGNKSPRSLISSPPTNSSLQPTTARSNPSQGASKSGSPRPATPRCSSQPGGRRTKGSANTADASPLVNTSISREAPSTEATAKRKLVLHFDVRNTVLVTDSVTNVNVEQALNSFLTGVTWGQEVEGKWEWYSETPSLTPPSKDVITYYKHLEQRLVKTPSDRALLRQVTGDFTQEPIGEKFHSHFADHLRYLRWPSEHSGDKTLTMAGSDGTLYHYILPAFFKMIHHLHEQGRDFCIIIRTYGLDAPNVLACTEHTLKGNHPQFPTALPIEVNNQPGKVFRTKTGKIAFEKYSMPDHTGNIPRETFTDEREIYQMLGSLTGVSAFVDDFVHWQDNNYHHTAGKPVWIDPEDPNVHHIIFDDNIRTTDLDSIVDLRIMDEGKSRSLDLEETVAFENMCLVQADLLESTSNVDYFIQKVRLCEQNYSTFLTSRTGIVQQ